MKKALLLILSLLISFSLLYFYTLHVSPSEKILEPNDAVNGIGLYWHGYEKGEVFINLSWGWKDYPNTTDYHYYSKTYFPYKALTKSIFLYNIDSLKIMDIIEKNDAQIISEWDFDPDSGYYMFDILSKNNKKLYGSYHVENKYIQISYIFSHNWK